MLGGSKEKIMCHTSGRFHAIILITWNLTDTNEIKSSQTPTLYTMIGSRNFYN